MDPHPDPACHRLLTVDAVRTMEARALAATPPGTLMSRAADALADACATLLRALPARTPVLAVVGPGNNGGDALLAACRLAERGWSVGAIALSPAAPTAADARRAHAAWHATGRPLASPEALDARLAEAPLVIDGLFGIGLSRPLDGAARTLVERIAAAGVPVVAVDVPSGLDADRGAVVGGPEGAVLPATVTVTLIADKPGLHTGAGVTCAGRVVVADLGVPAIAPAPDDRAAPGQPCAWGPLLDADSVAGALRPRPADAHKGRFGELLAIAGAPAMRGACILAALGAQAVGAGRLYVGLLEDAPADPLHPELMSRRIDPSAGDPRQALGAADAVVIGCGLGRGRTATGAVHAALGHPAALVLDADALNAVAADPALRERLHDRAGGRAPTVLTPHPLEAARLLGTTVAHVQGDRIASAHRIAAGTGAWVVLKGAGTVVAGPDGDWSINATGGPLLAVAGTGDVLAGAVGGLLAGGMGAGQAARLAVWLHGAAADRLSARPGWRAGIGLPASRLPAAMRAVINRRAGRC